jgi:hypothetical protein
MRYREARRQFDDRRGLWLAQVNGLVKALQAASCRPQSEPKVFSPFIPHELEVLQRADVQRLASTNGDADEPTEVLQNETIGFTLWWADSRENEEDRLQTAIRIRAQAELNADYATFSFYMDLGQQWDQPRLPDDSRKPGKRRRDALRAVADIKCICEAQLRPIDPDSAVAGVDWPLVPERLISPDGRDEQQLDDALMAARNLLYVALWEDFCAHFNCSLDVIAGDRGEVFANFRGLVLATDGLPNRRDDKPGPADHAARDNNDRKSGLADYAARGLLGSLGTQTFPVFDAKEAEPNAVLKAFWPFVRRITIGADYRDFIACGVMDYRALYVTALGSSSQYEKNTEHHSGISDKEEKDVERHVQNDGEASRLYADTQIRRRVGRSGNNHPVRYLLLTKCDPHPRQVGRILERINTMGTLRLFALKDWSAIKDADPFIRMLGQELDQKIRIWSLKRKRIDDWKTVDEVRKAKTQVLRQARADAKAPTGEEDDEAFSELLNVNILGKFEKVLRGIAGGILAVLLWRYADFIRQEERDRLSDVKFDVLYELTKGITKSLIDISARLDHIGAKCIGGLHFRLYRSGHYVKEFGILLDTLRVGNIPTWLGYDRFAKRGLEPTFDYISEVGTRLRALRDRLQSVTDTIETSALVVQSEATRKNTAVLRRIMIIGVIVILGWVGKLIIPFEAVSHGLGWATDWIRHTIGF